MKELNFHEHKGQFKDAQYEREWRAAKNRKCMTEAEILELSAKHEEDKKYGKGR